MRPPVIPLLLDLGVQQLGMHHGNHSKLVDVECAFGVVQSRFDIVRQPTSLWKQGDVINIMQACVILHNMKVEDEKDSIREVLDLNENPSATIVLPPKVSTSDNPDPIFIKVLHRNSAIKAQPTHRKLKKDLIEHIWQQRKLDKRRCNYI
jgi:hypothetical protein